MKFRNIIIICFFNFRNLRILEISQVVFMPNITYKIMLLFVYTTIHKRFVIFTSRYFKLSGNTTDVSQWKCRNFSCSSIKYWNLINCKSVEFPYHLPQLASLFALHTDGGSLYLQAPEYTGAHNMAPDNIDFHVTKVCVVVSCIYFLLSYC